MGSLEVHDYHTKCGECQYGGYGWPDSPANRGEPILTPESTECPRCGAHFTKTVRDFSMRVPREPDPPQGLVGFSMRVPARSQLALEAE